jgi:hypothetical protein
MIDKETAREIAAAFVAKLKPVNNDPLVIADSSTEECDVGWVFNYVRKKLLETNDPRYKTAGNDPILVDKTDGALYLCVGPYPPEQSTLKFRQDKRSLPRLSPPRG